MSNVVVTGSSSGIGRATAVALGRAGHTVFATVRNPDGATELRDTIEKEKLPISILKLDVDSDPSVEEAFSAARSRVGFIDALVNNAGVFIGGSIEELPLETFRAVMETNYLGSLRCIKACLPYMRERRCGCIVNVSSLAGRIAFSPMAPYAASKYALEALSEALAQEVRPFNIRVALVQPGIVDSRMTRGISTSEHASKYPHTRRLAGLFTAALANPVPPSVVADRIREIIESDSAQLRYPVGPDAQGLLGWRASMNDEAWVELGAQGDDAWYERVQRDLGLDARGTSNK
jgi:NAD(P)-dependent dehydrogenase (short-subunit alcohol dehydrogenase family)